MIKYALFIFSLVVLFSVSAAAHTTIFIPNMAEEGKKKVKILHVHPATGSGLMGIRLGVQDSQEVKGLESIFLIHENRVRSLNDIALPDYYIVRGQKRATYTIPINKKSGFFKPGDYIIVVTHKAHWKKHEDLYRRKVAKFYLNYWGLTSDWPNRVLKNMPEIIPLVKPYSVSAGSLFRAEAVNDEGRPIAHAKILIEYLNYQPDNTELETTTAFIEEDIADTVIFTDSNGSFSFIPPRKGLWTFTLVDGDSNKSIKGKPLEYDSSISIEVR